MFKVYEMPFKAAATPIESSVNLFQKTNAERIALNLFERPLIHPLQPKPSFSATEQGWANLVKSPSQPKAPLSAALIPSQTSAPAHLQAELNHWSSDSKSLLSAARGPEALKGADEAAWRQAGEFLSFLMPTGGPLLGGMALGVKGTQVIKGAATGVKLEIDALTKKRARLIERITEGENKITQYRDQNLMVRADALQRRIDNLKTIEAQTADKIIKLVNDPLSK